MKFGMMIATAGLLLAIPAAAGAADTWDNLVKVKAKRVDAAYLLPGADFRGYKRIMLDPVEVAFDKNWLRDYNSSSAAGTSRRISDDQAVKMLAEVQAGYGKAFAAAFTKAGYQIVSKPGPDVLRVGGAVTDIRVNAPDTMSAGRTRSYSREAGSAKLALEVRDSQTNALLGRAVDSRDIGDNGTLMMPRNSVTNASDFASAFNSWAKISVKALDELKANPPLAVPAK